MADSNSNRTMLSVTGFSCGGWDSVASTRHEIRSPVTGEIIAEVNAAGPDIAAMVDYARCTGGPRLREMTFHDRARLLKALAIHINANKDCLYALNPLTGATRRDGWYDIDGGIGTVFSYASKGRREMPDDRIYLDGGVELLSRNGNFLGQHVATPLTGVALQVNAFNFPVWGMLEKLAPALLAGVPCIVRPATVTSYLAAECFRLIIDSRILPEGAVQFTVGDPSGIFDPLDTQDIVCFTGSASTASAIRSQPAIVSGRIRLTVEQDSLNATVLGPDVVPESADFTAFIDETIREITTKAGQKCTAIRRILVPERQLPDVVEAITFSLSRVSVGDPGLSGVDMGPLVSARQLADVRNSAARIAGETELVSGSLEQITALGVEPGQGAFFSPLLFRCADADNAHTVHSVEAFGPVSVVMPYRDIAHASDIANRGGGSLVVSVFTSDAEAARRFTLSSAPWHGRIYFNNAGCMAEATGHGSPMPQMLHGGPGRAGGGEELGGIRSVLHFMQRSAVQGSPQLLTAITNQWVDGAAEKLRGRHPFRRFFDELAVGDSITTGKRQITLTDIEHFAEFTGDRFYAHMDDAAARRNPFFPGRVAHGYLLLSFAAGLFVDPEEGPVLANTGLSDLTFEKPVVAGESIHVKLTVKRKTPRTPEYGEIRWNVTILNQDGERVAGYELRTMNSMQPVGGSVADG
ncbi:MAG: phenylacetic acid degradation bifunctional protein PaaZ [Rhodobacteraceae bacterium]|nr:phenylacetic acid degradation bifunctional protein PaaZ [Paracoccaceae bacterium]